MSALLLAPLLLAVVLVASAVGKLRDPDGTRAAFVRLHVPRPLAAPWAPRALPWGELALAAGLLLLPGPWRLAAAVAALVLFVLYTWLVVRAWRSGEETTCQCFGTFTSGLITRWTVVRNVSLLVVCAAALAEAFAVVPPLFRAFAPDAVGWVLGAGVAGWVMLTILHEQPAAPEPAPASLPATTEGEVEAEGEDDYVRLPIPFGELQDADGGRHQLRGLAARRATLLVWLSLGCGSCQRIIDNLPGWAERLGVVDVRPVFFRTDGVAERLPTLASAVLLDPQAHVEEIFGQRGTPMAVLLGVDGLLAGGPVVGAGTVEELIEGMVAQLEEAGVGEPAVEEPAQSAQGAGV